ncbi:MAG: hypothetical protein NT069_22025 [Planctomycetota bacterium]|nr:hypothetical protein [Planctomycetota bacterium]
MTLLPDQSAFLKGRITLSRRLDLQITLDSGKMGLPGISGLTARAALIQGEYSCFLIDSIERDDFRLTGSLVLWEDIAATSDGIQGMLVVEDTRPISASRQRGDAEASIVLPVPKGQQPAKPITAVGARVRMRAIPFNSQSKTLDSLDWREVLSWQLAGNADDLKTQTEWHLSDLVLIKPKGSADSKTGPHVARGSLSSSDAPPVQGDFLTSINRSVDGGQESYKLELVPAVYAARVYQQPSPADFGTTRDDVVYPAGPEGSVGLAFDLMEPRPALGESAQADPAERLQLCALLIKDSKVQLLAVDSASIPFDLNSGSELLQPLSLQPLEVPQLVHREAFGARIRGRWRPADEQVGVPDATGEGADLRVGSTDVWLLSPLATTPRGVTALTLNVLVRSQGRSLDWTRLETEGLIAIHRHGGALFSVRSDQNALAIEAAPSVENLSTLTVLRSGAGGSQSLPPLFDDARVQEYAAGIGSSGVLVVRSADARGRVSYRFVNSLTHSLVPPATKQNKPSEPSPHTDLASAESDPRILPPADVAALETSGTPRYQPAQPLSDRPDSRGFRRPGSAKEESVNGIGIHIAEIPALRGAERPLKPLAGTTSSPSNDGAKPFLPSSFELAFALDKPGAVFHQVVRCFAPNRTSSATTFARREPQRFAPPTRAAMQLDAPSLERSSDRRTLKATVPWTETVGVVPVLESDFNIKLSFTNEPVNSPTFTLKEPGRAVLPISRLGERIQALPISGGSELVVPLTPFREGQSVEAFDFFLVTRAELTGLQLPNTTNTQVQPIFVALRGTDLDTDATRPPILLTDVMMEETAVTAGGYRVWRLKREKDKTPPFLTWLAKLPPLDDKSKIKLNLIWANSIKLGETTDAQKSTYVNAPKLYKDGLTLRDIRFQPQSPRLAAVLRLPEATGSGLLSTTREFTLFDGPAASAQTVVPSVELIGNDAEIRFQAKDCETIEFLDPLPAPTSGPSPGCGVILVKIFEDGATLTTDKVITPTP